MLSVLSIIVSWYFKKYVFYSLQVKIFKFSYEIKNVQKSNNVFQIMYVILILKVASQDTWWLWLQNSFRLTGGSERLTRGIDPWLTMSWTPCSLQATRFLLLLQVSDLYPTFFKGFLCIIILGIIVSLTFFAYKSFSVYSTF